MKSPTVNTQVKESDNSPVRMGTGGISRRDWMRTIFGGLGVLAASGSIYSCRIIKKWCGPKPRLEEFWKRVDEIQARTLVDHVYGAAKAQIGYSQLLAESERATILQSAEAGKEQRSKAEAQFQTRTEELRNIKTALAQLVKGIDPEDRSRFTEFLSDRSAASLGAEAREFVVKRLIVAPGILPEEAKEAIEKFDNRLDSIGQLRSFEDMVQFLDKHLDALLKKKFGNPDILRDICVLLLILTGMWVILLMIAALVFVLVCILTLGFLCDEISFQDILDNMIEDICG